MVQLVKYMLYKYEDLSSNSNTHTMHWEVCTCIPSSEESESGSCLWFLWAIQPHLIGESTSQWETSGLWPLPHARAHVCIYTYLLTHFYLHNKDVYFLYMPRTGHRPVPSYMDRHKELVSDFLITFFVGVVLGIKPGSSYGRKELYLWASAWFSQHHPTCSLHSPTTLILTLQAWISSGSIQKTEDTESASSTIRQETFPCRGMEPQPWARSRT